MYLTLGSLASNASCALSSRAPKPLIAEVTMPRMSAPPSAWAAANAVAPTPSRKVTMYSLEIVSPISRSSGDGGEAMVLVVAIGAEVVDDDEVDVDVDVDDGS